MLCRSIGNKKGEGVISGDGSWDSQEKDVAFLATEFPFGGVTMADCTLSSLVVLWDDLRRGKALYDWNSIENGPHFMERVTNLPQVFANGTTG
jgi:hypothetical protein